jgi:hypothetical protein
MVLDLNSSPPPDDEGGWEEPDVEDTTTGQILILPYQNLLDYMVHLCLICMQVLTFIIAAEEPDAHWSIRRVTFKLFLQHQELVVLPMEIVCVQMDHKSLMRIYIEIC